MLELIPLALTAATLLGYGAGLYRLHRRHVRWPIGRAACLAAGLLCVAAAVLPPVASDDGLLSVHVSQHLLLGMAGPSLLALSAPITLALRALPLQPRRLLLRLLHSRVVWVLTAPAIAVVLDIGGLYALYLTGLYARAEDDNLIHAAVHFHMFAAGCLLSWAIIGIDPIRRRPGFPTRIAALIVAGAAHDILTKLMYAHNLPSGGGPISDRYIGVELMYYGGTVIDLALATVVMFQWWRVTGRMLSRSTRHAAHGYQGRVAVGASAAGRVSRFFAMDSDAATRPVPPRDPTGEDSAAARPLHSEIERGELVPPCRPVPGRHNSSPTSPATCSNEATTAASRPWRPISGTGSKNGTPTRNPSSGPRPPTRSSNPSHDF